MAENGTTGEQGGNGPSGRASPLTPPQISHRPMAVARYGASQKFTANPFTGTGSLSIPIAVSPGRSSFGPQPSLTYDST